jgi:hypothetical protein
LSIIGAMIGKPTATKPFFLTDGSMDTDLLSSAAPPAVQAIVKAATGTAPADPDPMNPTYAAFNAGLMTQFGISGNS